MKFSDHSVLKEGYYEDIINYYNSDNYSFSNRSLPECKYQIGDVNTDSTISVADIVKMSRYLLGSEPITMDDYILYDLNYDSSVDVFDMIYMRKLLLNEY
ncbi:MAG: dockerin type I repeat-containing protein [Ruminococcus sp.]|nr:dockerin type I repeat-containing protein [Ruminococcus sp.]